MQVKASDTDRYIDNKAGYHSIILIYGPDQGLVSESAKRVIKSITGDASDPFNTVTLDTDAIAADPGLLADEAGAGSLFGGERIIRVRLSGAKQITKSVKVLLEQELMETTVIFEGGDLKKSNPIRSLIEKSKIAAAIPCYADDARSLQRLIQTETRAHNIRIAAEAEELLTSLLGEDRQTSRNEVQKLCLYGHGKEEITASDVELLVGDASASITDDTVDMVLMGKLKDGLSNFEQSLVMGHNSFQTISALQRRLLLLQMLVAEKDKGISIRDLVDRARPPIHFKRKQFVSIQLNIWTSIMIAKALDHVFKTIVETRLKPTLNNSLVRALLTQLGHVANRSRR